MSAPDFPAAVLFGHDGTLVNSEPQWAVAKRAVAGRYGVGWSTEDDLATLGRTVPASARLMAASSVPEDTTRLYAAIAPRRWAASMPATPKAAVATPP